MKAARIVVLIVALAAGGAAALLINSSNEKKSAPTALSPIAQILPDGPKTLQARQIGSLALRSPNEAGATALETAPTPSRPSASASRPTDDA
jgi:hypothetical protein